MPPGAETCNLVLNPGFESGNTVWSATSGVVAQNGPGEPAHSGTWNARMGGYGASHSDPISQSVTIPAGNQATLIYYVHIDSAETSTTSALDTMTVRAGSTAIQSLSNLNATSGYQLRNVDLSIYAGQTISLSFTGVENSSLQTSFVVDDIAVTTALPSTAPAAPTGVTATPGNAQAVVSWTPPAGVRRVSRKPKDSPGTDATAHRP